MKNKTKSENRKALPKFLAIVLVAGFIGGIIGGAMGFMGGTMAPEHIVSATYQLLSIITPYSIWIVTAACFIIELILYRQSKNAYCNWDGENEQIIEKAEEKLSWILMFTSANMTLLFFFFGIAEIPAIKIEKGLYALLLAGFILSLILIIIMQQKDVDLIKKINPEKKGSIYDPEFKTKWFNSCDENEQKQIGQASFKAFTVTNYVCIGLWFILIVTAKIFHTGILPMFIVILIWGISQIVYCYESIRLNKHN